MLWRFLKRYDNIHLQYCREYLPSLNIEFQRNSDYIRAIFSAH